MTGLVQISRRRGVIERVPFGEEPTLELHLEPNETVTDVVLKPQVGARGRSTVDWAWSLYVVTDLGAAS